MITTVGWIENWIQTKFPFLLLLNWSWDAHIFENTKLLSFQSKYINHINPILLYFIYTYIYIMMYTTYSIKSDSVQYYLPNFIWNYINNSDNTLHRTIVVTSEFKLEFCLFEHYFLMYLYEIWIFIYLLHLLILFA